MSMKESHSGEYFLSKEDLWKNELEYFFKGIQGRFNSSIDNFFFHFWFYITIKILSTTIRNLLY